MNHQMPLITRRAKTVQTTPKVTAKPLLEEFLEAVLGCGVEEEEGREDVEEVDDDDDEDEDDMSFGSRIVYLEKTLNFQRKMLRGVHTPRYPRLQVFDQVLLTPEAYAAYFQDRFDSKRRWIELFLGH
jgi:hypothetical protein